MMDDMKQITMAELQAALPDVLAAPKDNAPIEQLCYALISANAISSIKCN